MTPANKSSYPEAVQAISRGDVDALRTLLDREPDLVHERGTDASGATLLHCTAFNGVEELSHYAPASTPQIASLLIERGAVVDALAFDSSYCTPICWALSSWFTYGAGVQNKLVDAYLAGGAAIDGVLGHGAPLGHAIAFGYTRAVEHLATRGARTDHLPGASALGKLEQLQSWYDKSTWSPEALNFTRGVKTVTGRFSWPLPANPDPTALAYVIAATHGRVNIVKWLLDQGVSPDASLCLGQTALHFAAYQGHFKVVETLIAAGARTDLREEQFNKTAAEWARETDEHKLAELIDRSQQ